MRRGEMISSRGDGLGIVQLERNEQDLDIDAAWLEE
jgi:hypothetical protein